MILPAEEEGLSVVSILNILPWGIQHAQSHVSPLNGPSQRSRVKEIRIVETTVLFYANSLVNPLIYTIRMQEFRKALKDLICKKTP